MKRRLRISLKRKQQHGNPVIGKTAKRTGWITIGKSAQEKWAFLETIKPPAEIPSRYTQPKEANEFLLHWLTYEYLHSTLEFEPSENFDWREHAAKTGEYYARLGLDQLTKLIFAGDLDAPLWFESSISIDHGLTAQEAFAAIWMVSFKVLNK